MHQIELDFLVKIASNGKERFGKGHIAQPALPLGQKAIFEVGRVFADDRKMHVCGNQPLTPSLLDPFTGVPR